MPYIYAIKNLINDKMYVGSTKSIKRRKYHHFYQLKKGIHHSCHLQKAYDKYGKNSFIFYIIEECTVKNRKEREIYNMNINKTCEGSYGYNMYQPNEDRFTCAESTKQKISNTKINISKSIDMYDLNGNLINTYKSIYDCALQTNIYRSVISSIINGKRKSYKGLTFTIKNKPFNYTPSPMQRNMKQFYK